MSKTTYFYPKKTLNAGGRLIDLSTPKVMGILNVTPDSFYDGGRFTSVDASLRQAEKMVSEGADFIDIGAMSSRPGAAMISAEEETGRLMPVLEAVHSAFPAIVISVDTVHGVTAEAAIASGASIINDISGGKLDSSISRAAITHQVPYILMHMQGLPQTMQQNPQYQNVAEEVFAFLLNKSKELLSEGLRDIIIDPGFGFGKNVEQNYALIRAMDMFKQIGLPVLAGISRKSLICKLLHVDPENALNGTTALHAILLLKGVDILRVHDVKAAKEVIAIAAMMEERQLI